MYPKGRCVRLFQALLVCEPQYRMSTLTNNNVKHGFWDIIHKNGLMSADASCDAGPPSTTGTHQYDNLSMCFDFNLS